MAASKSRVQTQDQSLQQPGQTQQGEKNSESLNMKLQSRNTFV